MILVHDLQVHQIDLERHNEELRRSREALPKARDATPPFIASPRWPPSPWTHKESLAQLTARGSGYGARKGFIIEYTLHQVCSARNL
jgi:hypothetical protein